MLALRQLPWAVLLATSSCAPAQAGGDYRSAAPTAKLDAISRSAREGDPADLTRFVDQLDSDDPAVRLAASMALQRLTGQTHGYRHYDPIEQRRAAIGRWRQAVGAPDPDGSGNVDDGESLGDG